MPDRPKRRKNNKNKRKNKNNRSDANKTNSDAKNIDNSGTCNNQTENEVCVAEQETSNIVLEDTKPVHDDSIELIEDCQTSTTSATDHVNALTGDLNNNSSPSVSHDVFPESFEEIESTNSLSYVVESPEQSLSKNKTKLKNVKSKSLDNEEATNIVEITEDSIQPENNNTSLVESQNVIITDVESDIEWEKADEITNLSIPQTQEVATGTLSITTMPLTVAQCDENKSLTPDEEKSLRTYLKTLNLVTQPDNVNTIEIKTEIEEIINQEIKHRLRKKGLAEDFFLHRLGPPRILDVIDEEGSSESSITSRRQSYLSDKRSDVEDLDDDVFEDKNKSIKQKAAAFHPSLHKKSIGKLVPQECVLVGAKLKEPEVTEARGEWTMKTVEKMTGAEVVYLTDTSSSSSSLHEIGDDDDDSIDTDVSVRMITPTIEVTDTENFLKKTFIAPIQDNTEDNTIKITCVDQNEIANKLDQKLIEKNDSECLIKIELEDNPKDIVSNQKLEDDPKYIVSNQTDQIVELKMEKKVNTETRANFIDKSRKLESNENNYSDGGKHCERIINIEIENDIHNKCSTENSYTENPNEIVVLSTDNLKTDLYVKDINEPPNNVQNIPISEVEKFTAITANTEGKLKHCKYDLEAKIIKCEFNDAINNLIKEVSSDSEGVNVNHKDIFTRQDSSSSVSSSQCTAKYNPNYESLNDVSNIVHDDINVNNKTIAEQTSSTTSHVKDVFECVTGATTQSKEKIDARNIEQPSRLRDLCVRNIASLPYGDKILEELASVSKRLQSFTAVGSNLCTSSEIQEQTNSMPYYRLPDITPIEKITLSSKIKEPIPPPIQPRHSSLRKNQDDEHWTGIPTKSEPIYVCLSPSQKMLMDKTNTIITKDDASHLVDMHRKYVDRRGYNEYYKSEKQGVENEFQNPPIVPFKSQTGSRLLALIRDPALTRNISSITDRLNNSLDELQTRRTTLTTFTKNNQDRLNTSRNFSFKPIPPPRPKKYSTSVYESDESSDFTDNSMRSMKSERKVFHYSTGNLNKEIEEDISSIQNMHRFFTDGRDEFNDNKCPRRPSLPKDLCEQQMEYIRKKEIEVEAEIQRLEALKNNLSPDQKKGPRAPLVSKTDEIEEKTNDFKTNCFSRKNEIQTLQDIKKGKLNSLFSSSQEELLREKMYSEYLTQMAEREERKQHKVIKITNSSGTVNSKISKSMPVLDNFDSKVNNRIEKEFISKARERWDKLGIKDPETEDERESDKNVYKEPKPKVIEHKIKVIEGGKEKDVKKLPSHLQEFVRFTAKDTEQAAGSAAIWRPGAPPLACGSARSPGAPPLPPPPPVWSPGSAGASPQTPRKTFRPVHFEETPPARRKFGSSDQNGCTSGSESEGRLRTSQSAPVTGLSTLGNNAASRLPKAQNPTVTLLQKAREGQLSRGSNYIQQEKDAARLPRDRPCPPKGDPVHALRKEYASESEADRSDYERGGPRKMADAHRKVEGIGPITKDGMPVALRSEVKDPSRWYKKMYDTIHKNKYDDDYVTIRYKSRRGQPPERVPSNKSQYAYFDPRSGYLSEPEGGLSRLGSSTWSDAYDSDVTTGPRRRTASVQEERRYHEVSSPYMPSTNKYSTLASARASQEVYKNQPGRIENYMPGKSSVIDKESKQWWDEVMDIFDGQNISSTTSLPQASPKDKKDLTTTILSKSNMARALKESGYESDSTLVFRRREDADGPLSPAERRAAYRDLQAGGEPPLRGFRSPAPPRQESPRRYVESDVNIHYRCPVRHDPLPLVPERELAMQQAEHMKRLYREQRRNKYLQELQDMQNRRHQDNFTPSQKNILPLNRYDEAEKVIAKALYTFNGQTTRELSFRKGEMIHVRRQIDSNWYEGELHGRIGLFPYNYVEIQKGDIVQTPKKPVVVEGRARAKFDFIAQTNLELPLKKGEIVVLTRRIDQNWWEGRNAAKTGIFPDSYVTILQEPSPSKPEPQPTMNSMNSDKPMASPAAHGLLNGTGKRSMGAHSYTPQQNSQALSNAPPATQPLPGYVARPAQATLSASERGYGPPSGAGVDLNNTEPLYVDTNAEAVPFRAMYKYRPQNPDELELNEGDTVYVLEKCDDGWYVGSSQRTGRFGTFPGNYVERI